VIDVKGRTGQKTKKQSQSIYQNPGIEGEFNRISWDIIVYRRLYGEVGREKCVKVPLCPGIMRVCVSLSPSVVWEGKRGGMKITSNWTDRGTHAGIRVKKKG